MSRLYPRLVAHRARELARFYTTGELAPIDEAARWALEACVTADDVLAGPGIEFEATGGARTGTADLLGIRDAVLEIAAGRGFDLNEPVQLSADAARAMDADVARLLHMELDLTRHEAVHGGMWAVFGCLLMPAVIRWRFSSDRTSSRRFTGSRVRNYFARLWWRAETLRDPGAEDPYWLLAALWEDEQVQLTERANLVGCRALVLPVARQFATCIENEPGLPRMQIMRSLARRMLRLLGIVAFDLLTPEQCEAEARRLLAETLDGLTVDPPSAIATGVRETSSDTSHGRTKGAANEDRSTVETTWTSDQLALLESSLDLKISNAANMIEQLTAPQRRLIRRHFESYEVFIEALGQIRDRGE